MKLTKRFLFLVAVISLVFTGGCQLSSVEKLLNGVWTESYDSSAGNVVLNLTFDDGQSAFTWIEKLGDSERINRTGSYIVYLNDRVEEARFRAAVVLRFSGTPDAQAEDVAFWFSFSKEGDSVFLNLDPIKENGDLYVLTRIESP